jgi:hypothetical protein
MSYQECEEIGIWRRKELSRSWSLYKKKAVLARKQAGGRKFCDESVMTPNAPAAIALSTYRLPSVKPLLMDVAD